MPKFQRSKLIEQWFREAVVLDDVGCREIPGAKHGELHRRFERVPEYEAAAARFAARWLSPGRRRLP